MHTEPFKLHPQLAKDTFEIINNDFFYLGLHKNALVTWLILVPKTTEKELFNCTPQFKKNIQNTVDYLACYTKNQFEADKMNIATIGNIVSQLHIHIIARKTNDFVWPETVWGHSHSAKEYTFKEKEEIIQLFQQLSLPLS